jgi:hypothetical protein
MFMLNHDNCKKDKPSMEECLHLPKLLEKIADLKKQGLIVERVAFSFMKQLIQPLMKRVHLKYEYTGEDNDSRLKVEEINNDLIMEW